MTAADNDDPSTDDPSAAVLRATLSRLRAALALELGDDDAERYALPAAGHDDDVAMSAIDRQIVFHLVSARLTRPPE